MTAAKKMWYGLLFVQRFLLFITSLFILLIMAVNVALRYFFKLDFYGMQDIVLIAAWWCYFLGAAYGTYEKSHLSADIVSLYIKNEHIKAVIKLIVSLATMGVSAIFAYWSYIQLMWALTSRGRTVVLQLPLIIPQSAIILGFFLICFYSLINLVLDVREFLSKRENNWVLPGDNAEKDEVS